MELWTHDGKLVNKENWAKTIERLHSSVGVPFSTKKDALDAVRDAVCSAVKKRLPPLPSLRFGVFLSGGVDSSLLAVLSQKYGGNFTCYTVGFEGFSSAPDVVSAQRFAEQLGLRLCYRELSLDEVETFIVRAVRMLKSLHLAEPVHVGVAAVVIAASELAQQDGVTLFFGGLGAEEIFAGYQRHLRTADVQEECWKGLLLMWTKDLQRDASLGAALGISVATPFLDEKLIINAMRVPGELKVVDGERKVILREVAEELGVPHEFAWRKKQAVQYGSGFDKALEKIAKRNGFKWKGEYLGSL